MFLPLWRTQRPLPAMASSEILSGSGNPRWNHFPRHDGGNEHREEEEPEMIKRMASYEMLHTSSNLSSKLKCKGELR